MRTNALKDVPDIVVGRLPIYLRTLTGMQATGKAYTSSHELADALGLSSAQIRKDLSHFGEFGKQGTGYSVQPLVEHLREILKLNHEWPVVLIGAGHIGSALANYTGFADRGFRIVGVFDNDAARIGHSTGAHLVQDMRALADVVREQRVHHAMIAVPVEAAQAVADAVVATGIRAILSYAPVTLTVPKGVRVEYIDPVLHLQRMTYHL